MRKLNETGDMGRYMGTKRDSARDPFVKIREKFDREFDIPYRVGFGENFQQ